MTESVLTGLRYTLFVCGVVGVVENLLVVAVFAGTKSLRSKQYGFIFNMALSDLFFSVCTVTFTWTLEHDTVIPLALMWSGFLVSVLTILAVAVNRLLMLSLLPDRYHALVTPCRMATVIIFFWCLALFAYMFPLIVSHHKTEYYFLMKSLLSPLGVLLVWLVTVVLYVIVFRKIKKMTASTTIPGGEGAMEPLNSRVVQTRRLVITFILILGSSFLCWMPSVVLEVTGYFHVYLYYRKNITVGYRATIICYSLSAVINPMIYWGRLDGFREAFHALFCRCLAKPTSEEKEVDNVFQQSVENTTI